MNEIQTENINIQVEITNKLKLFLEDEIKQGENENLSLESKLKTQKEEIIQLKNAVNKSFTQNIILKDELYSEINQLTIEIERIKSINLNLKGEINKIDLKLENTNKEYTKCNEINSELNKETMFQTKKKQELTKEKSDLIKMIEKEKRKQVELERVNSNYIEELRFLHNELLENKGNIRVFCRVRPLLNKEIIKVEEMKNNKETKELFDNKYIEYIGNEKLIINGPFLKSTIGKSKDVQQKDIYSFDRVFPPSSLQKDIFEEISQLVQSALDGYKVCIFAYGQTGSGKTYTMEGENNEENRGIVSRSVEKIFQVQEELKKLGWQFYISLSYFEIYLDNIHDLLSKNKDVIISKHNQKDIISIQVNSYEETIPLLINANNKRTKAETLCNEKSSRSHSICQLKIVSKLDNIERNGTLNFIDLAGSEKVSNSKVEGDNLKEAISINKSLSCLKGVISSLTINNSKNVHIPYRESVLTYILQQYLGGDSKTLMFVNISPLITQISETNNSLKFATEVNSCQINK